jgi:hypothetical protein
MVEKVACNFHTGGVVGSIPTAPTTYPIDLYGDSQFLGSAEHVDNLHFRTSTGMNMHGTRGRTGAAVRESFHAYIWRRP